MGQYGCECAEGKSEGKSAGKLRAQRDQFCGLDVSEPTHSSPTTPDDLQGHLVESDWLCRVGF